MAKKTQGRKRAAPGRRTLTADDLRWLGESADGERDKDCTVVWIGNNLKVVQTRNVGSNKPLGVDVKTPSRGLGMRGGLKVSITFEKDEPIGLDAKVDAIFLTQSAVEKFVLPYYMRMQRPEWVAKTRDALFKKDIVAVLHRSPSSSKGMPRKVLTPLLKTKKGPIKILDEI